MVKDLAGTSSKANHLGSTILPDPLCSARMAIISTCYTVGSCISGYSRTDQSTFVKAAGMGAHLLGIDFAKNPLRKGHFPKCPV